MRRSLSALIFRGVKINLSSVTLRAPSREFSTGTTPQSTEPFSTSSKTRAMPLWGKKQLDSPKCKRDTKWENDASGPKKAIVVGFCKSRDAELISRKIALTAAGGSGPEFNSCK